MRLELVSFALALALAGCASAPPVKVPPKESGPAVVTQSMAVTRYTERPLSEYQALVMNEATKLSFACRMFRGLYGRWPANLAEIQGKTEGINFDVFAGKAAVTPLPDDSERIEVFDGFNTRAVKAVPISFGINDATRDAAKAPNFKIRL